jgi:hypothetical protein
MVLAPYQSNRIRRRAASFLITGSSDIPLFVMIFRVQRALCLLTPPLPPEECCGTNHSHIGLSGHVKLSSHLYRKPLSLSKLPEYGTLGCEYNMSEFSCLRSTKCIPVTEHSALGGAHVYLSSSVSARSCDGFVWRGKDAASVLLEANR